MPKTEQTRSGMAEARNAACTHAHARTDDAHICEGRHSVLIDAQARVFVPSSAVADVKIWLTAIVRI